MLTDENYNDHLHTMATLDLFLYTNSTILQHFSASYDFSGENIAFLARVSAWKAAFADCLAMRTRSHRLHMYNAALDIYIEFISLHYAEFPLNLLSQHLKPLDNFFGRAARIVCGESDVDVIAPFLHGPTAAILEYLRYTGHVPNGFDLYVFDEVEAYIKDLVLMTTWPRFVEEMQDRQWVTFGSESRQEVETARGGMLSRVMRLIRPSFWWGRKTEKRHNL